jgi:hypothetical protein
MYAGRFGLSTNSFGDSRGMLRCPANPNVAPILAKEFVGRKLDADRMAGGADVSVLVAALEEANGKQDRRRAGSS